MPRAVFLDKDGTLVENVPYNVDIGCIQFQEGVLPGLRRLQGAGFCLVIVSNQAGVGLGRFSKEAFESFRSAFKALLTSQGIVVSGFYSCFHHPKAILPEWRAICPCRKPAPGLLLEAAKDLGLELEESWMVGDILDDIEAGRRAGCQTALLDVGNETEWRGGEMRLPDIVAKTFSGIVEGILGD